MDLATSKRQWLVEFNSAELAPPAQRFLPQSARQPIPRRGSTKPRSAAVDPQLGHPPETRLTHLEYREDR